MIIQKRKNMFVAKQKGILVCAVIAPTRNEARIINDYFIGLHYGNKSKQRAAGS